MIIRFRLKYKKIVLSILLLTGTVEMNFGQAQNSFPQEKIDHGIKVSFSMNHVDKSKPTGVYTKGDDVNFVFTITDTISGKGVSGAAPAAWMEPVIQDDKSGCEEKISAFIGGSLFKRAELDLNVYYVLAMNQDATISVVDPLFGFGGSQLLDLITLENPGMDWQIMPDQSKVYITIPLSEKVAVINTSNWKVEKYISINAQPSNISIQPDLAYAWVDFTSNKIEDFSGVAVIDTREESLKSSIVTGLGSHLVTLDHKNEYAFVTNSIDQNVSIIDINTLTKVADIKLNGTPVSMDWSRKSHALYIAEKQTNNIVVIDPAARKILTKTKARPGAHLVKFEPSGRFLYVINKENDLVQILDAASNRIVQTGDTEPKPHDITFSDELAYLTHSESETILMFPLDHVGIEGQQLQAADFPGGQFPPGKNSFPSLAPGMVQAPGASAILIANPGDKSIYYYLEGMAAPMGSFSNYNRVPRAVEVIDRSLEERNTGVYSTVGKIRGSGEYEVPFFLDAPRLTQCFKVYVENNLTLEEQEQKKALGPVEVQFMINSSVVEREKEFAVEVKLIDPGTHEKIIGLEDVRVRGTSPGNWYFEDVAKEVGKTGVYSAVMSLPDSGIYYIYVECLSKKLPFNNPQYLILRAL